MDRTNLLIIPVSLYLGYRFGFRAGYKSVPACNKRHVDDSLVQKFTESLNSIMEENPTVKAIGMAGKVLNTTNQVSKTVEGAKDKLVDLFKKVKK